jgi:hypothetical protein
MYSKSSWGGSVDPYILVKMVKLDDVPDTDDPIVSLVVFEWEDRPLVGRTDPNDASLVRYMPALSHI